MRLSALLCGDVKSTCVCVCVFENNACVRKKKVSCSSSACSTPFQSPVTVEVDTLVSMCSELIFHLIIGEGRGGEGSEGAREGPERSRQSDRRHYVIPRHRTSSGSF